MAVADRANNEAIRLATSQLVLGLQRTRSGGNMVILLHKADAWHNVLLMHMFTAFSDTVQLFKPQAGHRMRSSFYLVAKGVRPEHEAAVEAVRRWKGDWAKATFWMDGGDDDKVWDERELDELRSARATEAKAVLEEFGPTLLAMVEPVFAVQAEALREAPWMVKTG